MATGTGPGDPWPVRGIRPRGTQRPRFFWLDPLRGLWPGLQPAFALASATAGQEENFRLFRIWRSWIPESPGSVPQPIPEGRRPRRTGLQP